MSICLVLFKLFNCIGEQDENAFDISQLKKPIDSPRGRLRAPAVEKVMPPPIPSTNRPRKWGKSNIFGIAYVICVLDLGCCKNVCFLAFCLHEVCVSFRSAFCRMQVTKFVHLLVMPHQCFMYTPREDVYSSRAHRHPLQMPHTYIHFHSSGRTMNTPPPS